MDPVDPTPGELAPALDQQRGQTTVIDRPRSKSLDGKRHLAELLAAIGDGDGDAFAVFYRQTSDRAYGLALRVLRSRAMAEEIVQEVYLQVWLSADRYDERMSSPVGWLAMLTHRRSIDRIRTEAAATGHESRYGRLHAAREHDVVFEGVEQHLQAQAVLRGLHSLTARQRESIVLAYYHGLTYPQVAERLRTPLPTVKARIRDGLKRLSVGLIGDMSIA